METLEHSDKPKSQDNERLSQTKLEAELELRELTKAYLEKLKKDIDSKKTNGDSRKILTIEALKANNHGEDIYGKGFVTKVSVKKYKKGDIEDEIKQLEELKKENKILGDVKINADGTYTYIKDYLKNIRFNLSYINLRDFFGDVFLKK